jgi:hypothetical protein
MSRFSGRIIEGRPYRTVKELLGGKRDDHGERYPSGGKLDVPHLELYEYPASNPVERQGKPHGLWGTRPVVASPFPAAIRATGYRRRGCRCRGLRGQRPLGFGLEVQ